MGKVWSKKLGVAVALGALVVIGMGLLSPSGVSAGGGTISISSLEMNVEFEGKVDLTAHEIGEPGLGAWTIDVHYNPEVVTLLGCEAEYGGICNPELSEKSARVTGVSAHGLPGDSFLGTLFFGCKKVGSSDLVVSLNVLADATVGDPQPIDADVLHGDIFCVEEHDKLLGDANCDNEVNAVDATLILQYGAEMIDLVPCADLADVNGDGLVDAVDAAIILQKVAGLIE